MLGFFFRLAITSRKLLVLIEIDFERKLHFEFIVKIRSQVSAVLSYLKGLFISLQAWRPKVADAFDKNPCIFQVPSYWASKSNECKWCTLSAVYCIVRTLSSHILAP